MRKHKLFVFLGMAMAVIVLSSRSLGLAEISNQDRTGAPGATPSTCAACHNSGPFVVSTNISLLDEITGATVVNYIPGNQYDLKFEIESTGSPAAFGFQGTAVLDSDASNAGVFSQPSANAQVEDVNGRHIVEHNDQSVSNSFTVKWTAPLAGSGSVSFYGVGVAANFNGSTSGDDGSPSAQLTIAEGTVQEIEGCTNPDACNFNPDATTDNGSCLLPDGCTDETACNYDPQALCDDGSCIPAPCVGCTYPSASNYTPFALEDDGSCQFPSPQDYCGDGTLYNPETGKCEAIPSNCPADLDGNTSVGTGDVLILLSAFGSDCP